MRSCRRFLAGIPHQRVGSHVFLTRPPLTRIAPCAFDLHVLGTPPAFILSQDQTRHPMVLCPFSLKNEPSPMLSRDPDQESFYLACSQILCTNTSVLVPQ